MVRKVLVETSLFLRAFDPATKDAPGLVQDAKSRLRQLARDPEVAFAITPLIYFEALRGIEYGNSLRAGAIEGALEDFEEFDIGRREAELAARLAQFARAEGGSLERRRFDVLHWACAQVNGLEIESADGDIEKLQKLYEKMISSS